MANVKTRKSYAPSFKAKQALEAVRETQTLNELGQAYGVHSVQVGQWKKRLAEHAVYPYLLRGVPVRTPNQVWSTDITYLRLRHGFGYLVAIMDWYSRKVLSWRLSNTLDTDFCLVCLDDAVATFGRPEIFNSDQGTQFTSRRFTERLQSHQVRISMDGRGRAVDNIYRCIFYACPLSTHDRNPQKRHL